MKDENVIVVFIGCGKLAKACLSVIADETLYDVRTIKENINDEDLREALPVFEREYGKKLIFFHCGSGRLLTPVMDFCENTKIPLIQASSSLKDANDSVIEMSTDSKDYTSPFIDAPNLALPIVAQLKAAEQLGKMLAKVGIDESDVLESHQCSKMTVPKTACEFGKCFGVEKKDIQSIRNQTTQKTLLGIPEEHLDGHAFHLVNLESCDVGLAFCTRVYGRRAYGEGLLVLIKKILEMGNKLKPGYHRAQDLIFDD